MKESRIRKGDEHRKRIETRELENGARASWKKCDGKTSEGSGRGGDCSKELLPSSLQSALTATVSGDLEGCREKRASIKGNTAIATHHDNLPISNEMRLHLYV